MSLCRKCWMMLQLLQPQMLKSHSAKVQVPTGPKLDGALPSAPVASEQTLEAALRQGESLDWRGFFYGAFHFTPKKQAQWSWQAACPFHALNCKAGCRKAMNVTPVTQEKYAEILCSLKHWCNQAQAFNMQRDHMALHVTPEMCRLQLLSRQHAFLLPRNQSQEQ